MENPKPLLQRIFKQKPLTITPRGRQPVLITPGLKHPHVISQPQRAVWDDRGWIRQEEPDGTEVYIGNYQVMEQQTGQLHRFAGRIRMTVYQAEAYVCDPPRTAYTQHPKWRCFVVAGGMPAAGLQVWYQLHWKWRATDPDTAILCMEEVLYEAINNYSDPW